MKDIAINPDEEAPYECFTCGTIVLAVNAPDECKKCGGSMRNRLIPIE